MARILVADDDRAVAEFVRRALTHHGHEVVVVEDGLQALHALQTNGEFELLLTDIVMPGMDGIALALKVARDYPDLKVLLMSGYAAERQRAHNLDVIIQRVIPKPFTLQELMRVVGESLATPKA
ncbi:MAG TPA: response regulator [Alphaproteobacteria bacterium]|jgi:two-component system cell cycle response regulator CpdR|nr:response regulator [Alphaproteobacteria bacterium]